MEVKKAVEARCGVPLACQSLISAGRALQGTYSHIVYMLGNATALGE